MRKFVLVFAILFCCSICLLAQGKQDVTVVNKTGVIINELHVTPSDADEWGEDILGKDALDLDEECDIEFDPKEDVCLWDLRIADSDGNAIEWEKIDLCKAVKIVLHYKDGKAWADIVE
jgi:hypothetical protein